MACSNVSETDVRGSGGIASASSLSSSSEWPPALLSPSPRVDELWHALILDTLAYKEACEAMLGAGGFLHHDPRGGRAALATSAAFSARIGDGTDN